MRQRVDALVGERVGAQLELAGRRAEAARGVRQRALAEVDLGEPARAEVGGVDRGGCGGEHLGEHLLVGLAEGRVVEAERPASRRKISLFGRHSPTGSIAGSFSVR